MRNIKQLSIKTLRDVEGYIKNRYGSFSKFCELNNLEYYLYHPVISGRVKKYKSIKKICNILEIDFEEIEEWSDI